MSELHVVTGAAGFLGTHLTRELLAKGHRVRAVDVVADSDRSTGVEWFTADCADQTAMDELMVGADVVHHTVAHVPLRRPSEAFTLANSASPGVVCRAADRAGVRQVVLVSSSAIYGLPKSSPMPEGTTPSPFEPYGRAKLAGEESAIEALEGSATKLSILRPRTILGPGRLGIFGTLFRFIQEERNVYTIGPSDGPLQFVHVDDVISAMTNLATGSSGVFGVGTNLYSGLRTELEDLIAFTGSSSKVVALPLVPTQAALAALWYARLSPLSPWHYRGYAHSFDMTTTGLNERGWSATWSNAEMLQDAWSWFVTRQDPTGTVSGESVHRSDLRERVLGLVRKLS